MNVVNAKVQHSKYGIGLVADQADNIITVRFGAEYGMKKFLYPSAFENYLTLCSDELRIKQMDEIAQRLAEYEAIQKQKYVEEEKRIKDEKTAVKALKKKTVTRKKLI